MYARHPVVRQCEPDLLLWRESEAVRDYFRIGDYTPGKPRGPKLESVNPIIWNPGGFAPTFFVGMIHETRNEIDLDRYRAASGRALDHTGLEALGQYPNPGGRIHASVTYG
jgi:hypothetical protein